MTLRKSEAEVHASNATGSHLQSCHGAILPLSSVCNHHRRQQSLHEFLAGNTLRKKDQQLAAFGIVGQDRVRAAQHGAQAAGVHLRQSLAIGRE